MAEPRYLTPRSSPHTFGPQIAKVAHLLGSPLMPWQVLAADLIGEHDGHGRPIHKTVVITVPRQSGKTRLMHAVMLQRLFTRPQARVWYTAESGVKAKTQLVELIDGLELPSSKLGTVTDCKRGAGNTSVKLPALGSTATAFNPDKKGIHGKQADLVVIDEAWYFNETQAAEIMAGVTPTKNTRPHAQTIILSTMGDANSTWFHGYIERGRKGSLALIDYGIGDDVDPGDDEAIIAAHPAIGYTSPPSIIADARKELEGQPSEFVRAYGNRPTTARSRLIPADVVELATTTDDLPPGEPVFAVAVSFDRDDVVIVAAVENAARPVVEVVERFSSTDGVARRLVELVDRHGGHVAVAVNGPAASIAAELERLPIRPELVDAVGDADLSAATVDFLDRIRRPMTDSTARPDVRIRAHAAFSDAFDAVALKTSGDKVFLSRRGSAGSITSIEAAVLAVRALYTRPAPPVAPLIITGG
ncbi:hypothetical protein [Gordonia malaquae]|uniref:Putative large terminase subunit n=1 Tax=Gordonia phage GRU3 TaxID=1647473 RepID=A0A0K0N6G5_9CAUD|nr:putative large terminase subunit [Gordonia phage GRU3]AKJ72251.1 putative large terminase subunit [Gordonia phage GRU3]